MTTKYCRRNEGKLILCTFFARSPDTSTVLFCYYLLRGDTAVPSGQLARLCHAFLVLYSIFSPSWRAICFSLLGKLAGRAICFADVFLARSAKLPEGLYILPMFFLYFFSPLGKLAGRAIYFTHVF